MKSVTKRRTCGQCKARLGTSATGRPPAYCCAACRQQAYRERLAARPTVPLQLLQNDLRAMRDREAKKRGAIALLEDLGYTVHLEILQSQPLKTARQRRPPLVALDQAAPRDGRPASNSTPVADP